MEPEAVRAIQTPCAARHDSPAVPECAGNFAAERSRRPKGAADGKVRRVVPLRERPAERDE
jgi:hypothetical protein